MGRAVVERGVVRADALARLLVGTQFAFNVGFYAVLPHLAAHLSGGLGLAGWLVGVVLGLRTFSQQGMFVVGGALADRFGPRPAVLVGCALRVLGFGWLAFASGTASVIGAVLLIGFAAALFSPAVESEVARQALEREQRTGEPRTKLLGTFHAGGQAGALIGPVLGALLLGQGFRAVALVGAAVFVVILVGHWFLMPGREPVKPPPLTFRGVAGNRAFLLLCLAYGGYLVIYNQMYLTLPAELERATGGQAALGWLFALSSVIVVALQVPLSKWAGRTLTPAAALRWGLGVLVAGCALPALLPATGLTGSVVFVVLLTGGQMLAAPAARALVPDLVDERLLGTFMGAMSSLSGLLVLATSAPLGAVAEAGGAAMWLGMAVIPLVGVLLVPRAARA